jgi:hypothetical protein
MPQYKNSPERYPLFRLQIIVRMTILMLIITIGSFCISYFSGEKDSTSLYISLILMFFVLVAFSYIIVKTIKQQKIIYDSFNLTVGLDYLSRTQSNLPAITLFFNDIDKISENRLGYLKVDGKQKGQFIIISPYLEDKDKLKNELQSIKPFSDQRVENVFTTSPFLLPLITIGSMAAIYISSNKVIVAIGGAILIPLLAWSFFKIGSMPKSANPLAKNRFLLVIVFISIIATIYYKLFA